MLFTGFAHDKFTVYDIPKPDVHFDPTRAKSNVIIRIDTDTGGLPRSENPYKLNDI